MCSPRPTGTLSQLSSTMPPRSIYFIPIILCALYFSLMLFQSNVPSFPHFLTRHGEYSPLHEYKYLLKSHPMVIFSKSYCPYSTKAKDLLVKTLSINPGHPRNKSSNLIVEPHVVELNLHSHGSELQGYIASQTGRKTVPNVVVKGVSIGGSDDIAGMFDQGTLVKKLQDSGLRVVQ
ncbi:Monothiol glutaredoxin-7 [Neolecta irregularis DAH-3]|uniref:Monothiol glutaredoxin-7 n=1 Tax=Neolecta irregularis (strain DAH-3) TaxID=1198029 RepID=A0A1U7LTY8_NEOID|nr:Monothiol glutaredoxin-7 [Neolecta irregularis DAH-3]|eukprot:OLL26043.1 Monothiol glutaredoxin-7 [Neolecta irregularis DAH-3]